MLSIDSDLQASLSKTLSALDIGLHISPANRLQEWKVYNPALENSTHRHLSHLVGWYPGNSLSSYQSAYTNRTIATAIRNSLLARGPGIADSNAGWEKVWRAACWARLNDSDTAYAELRLAVRENMAGNLLSMYDGKREPFQIDANYGFGGAVLAMLVVDLARALGDHGIRTVVLGPAIPGEWARGSVEGLRIRGGGVVDFSWDLEGVVDWAVWVKKGVEEVRVVNKRDEVLL